VPWYKETLKNDLHPPQSGDLPVSVISASHGGKDRRWLVIPMKLASRSDSNRPPVPGEKGWLF